MAKQARTTKLDGSAAARRTYRMQRRAELVDATRQRIVEATVRLHTTVGPANASIAAIAEEAGVTRLTVYPTSPTPRSCSRPVWRPRRPLPAARPGDVGDEPGPRRSRPGRAHGGVRLVRGSRGRPCAARARHRPRPAGAIERNQQRQEALVDSIVGDGGRERTAPRGGRARGGALDLALARSRAGPVDRRGRRARRGMGDRGGHDAADARRGGLGLGRSRGIDLRAPPSAPPHDHDSKDQQPDQQRRRHDPAADHRRTLCADIPRTAERRRGSRQLGRRRVGIDRLDRRMAWDPSGSTTPESPSSCRVAWIIKVTDGVQHVDGHRLLPLRQRDRGVEIGLRRRRQHRLLDAPSASLDGREDRRRLVRGREGGLHRRQGRGRRARSPTCGSRR